EVQAEFETRFVRLIATAGESYPVGALLAVMASRDVTTAEVDAFIAAFRPAGAAGESARAAGLAGAVASPGSAAAPGPIPSAGSAAAPGAIPNVGSAAAPGWGTTVGAGMAAGLHTSAGS